MRWQIFGPPGSSTGARPVSCGQAPAQLVPAHRPGALTPSAAPRSKKKGARPLEPQRAAKQDVVADPGMAVQGQMRAVDSQVMLDQELEHLVTTACPGMASPPEQPVMNQQEIGPGLHGHANRRRGGVDRGGQPGGRFRDFEPATR